jgi:hypothetical protein
VPDRGQSPGLALGGAEEPALPILVAVWLVAEQLHPGERTRVVNVLARCPDGVRDLCHELAVELQLQLRFVAEEPDRQPGRLVGFLF